MAKLGAKLELKISTDKLDEFALIQCVADECKNNMGDYKGDLCNLKHIRIGEDGNCADFEKRG